MATKKGKNMSWHRKAVFVTTIVVVALSTLGWYLGKVGIAELSPHGTIGDKERSLILFALGLSVVVVVPVFVLLGFISWKYRANNHKSQYRPEWDHNNFLETAWWLIPGILIAILSVVTWVSSHELDPFKPLSSTASPIRVQVVALNWKWLFIYPDYDIATVNQLEVPTNTPINFSITSDAPMNSFWIPQLGGQIYAMPGMSTQLHLDAKDEGDYVGRSANISGNGFAGMTFMTHARSTAEFNSWIQSVRRTPHPLSTSAYSALSQPSTYVKPDSYSTVQSRLYDTIVMKYMVPQGDMQGMGM